MTRVGRWPSLPCVGRMAAFSRRPSSPAAATRTTRLHLGLLRNLRGIVDRILLIPRSLAYVLLIGLPPQVGLYALSGTTGMQISHANAPVCGSHAASFG